MQNKEIKKSVSINTKGNPNFKMQYIIGAWSIAIITIVIIYQYIFNKNSISFSGIN